jgi:hypothetical protein
MMEEVNYFHLPLTEEGVKWDTRGAFTITRSPSPFEKTRGKDIYSYFFA